MFKQGWGRRRSEDKKKGLPVHRPEMTQTGSETLTDLQPNVRRP
jgi:hypothetical protein